MKAYWMNLKPRTRKIILAVSLPLLLTSASFAYAEGWFGGLFGANAKPVVVASVAPAAPLNIGPMPTRAEALQLQPNDRVLGRFGAPITIIEYASMTCHHCADFKTETMPSLKKDWLDTGKAVYVLRDLAWDNLALGMSAVARCVPPAQFYPLSNALYAAQKKIVTGNPIEEINATAALAGLTPEQVKACIGNPDIQKDILRSKEIALTVLQVKGTPAIFVNGQLVEGAVKYDTLKKTLDAAFAQTSQAK